jgi:chitin disaccharide deacetylase
VTRLILCADDYALAPGVSRTIRELIAAGRLSATGCMTVRHFWPEEAQRLRPLADQADIGLHLTLTDFPPLGPMPGLAPEGKLPALGRLLALALLGRLPAAEISAELERQLDAFERHFGRPPAFLDGHKHIQQFPGVREAVITLWQRRLGSARPWLRIADKPSRNPKGWPIAFLGRGLRRGAVRAGIPVNDRFSGIYDLTDRVPYAGLFERFLADTSDGQRPLIMCHPGEIDAELIAVDPVTVAREAERRFFAGAEFLPMLARHGLTLGRFA